MPNYTNENFLDDLNFNRRKFLASLAGVGITAALPWEVRGAEESGAEVQGAEVQGAEKLLKITSVTVKAGAEKPFKALQISDSHLCLADARENDRKRKLAKSRFVHFSKGEKCLDASLAYAAENNELLLYTGDLIDFVSEENLEAIHKKLKPATAYGSSGNHEFSQYVGEAREDAAYKAQSFERVQKAYPNDLTLCSRIVNGINFVAFDDVYYNMTADQLARFKAEAAKGLPIVALCHCPLYTPELFDTVMQKPGARCSYLVGVPDSKTKNYEPHRYIQQRPDRQTLDFIQWLKDQSLLKAIFCGHLHFGWSGQFSATAKQYVVGANYSGQAYEISFT